MENSLGKILISMSIITEEELKTALDLQKKANLKLLGTILIENKFCTKNDIKKALKIQKENNLIGRILFNLGVVSFREINNCIDEQEKNGGLFGDILLKKGYCNKNDIDKALKIQNKDPRIGMILLNKSYIDEVQLEEALLEKDKNKDMLLGEIILNKGYINEAQLKNALDFHNILKGI